MSKRQINFSGPSIEELGINVTEEKDGKGKDSNSILTNTNQEENSIAKNGNSDNGNNNIGNIINGNANITASNNSISELKNAIIDNSYNGKNKIGNANIKLSNSDNSENGNVNIGTSKKRNTVQYRMIKNYLDSALGNSEKIEVKLSEICENLGINLKTFYKHLKTLRETEFILTKLQYGTEIKRRK